MAVPQLDLRVVHLALVEFHRAFILVDDRELRIELLFGYRVLGEGLLVTREIEPRVLQQRAVAGELAGKSLHIVTNSLPIAETLEARRNIELTLTGGYLDPRIRVMLGPLCEQMLGLIRADVLIMGISSMMNQAP